MTAKKETKGDYEYRIGLLEYQYKEIFRVLQEIKKKQDDAIRQIDTLKYLDQHEFDQYVKDAEKKFASASTVKWLLGLVGGIFVGTILAIVGVALR